MKTYQAYIAINDMDYFCNLLNSLGGNIKSIKMTFSERGDVIYDMIIEAPDGIIDPNSFEVYEMET